MSNSVKMAEYQKAMAELQAAKDEIAKLQAAHRKAVDEVQSAQKSVEQSGNAKIDQNPYGEKEYWDKRYESSASATAKGGENTRKGGVDQVDSITSVVSRSETYEWYLSSAEVQELLEIDRKAANLDKDSSKILVSGVGNSTACEDLSKAGYTDVHGMDYSAAVIKTMRARRKKLKFKGVHYFEADATHMPQIESGSYDIILDKGTLDAIVSSGAASSSSNGAGASAGSDVSVSGVQYMREMWRVLNNNNDNNNKNNSSSGTGSREAAGSGATAASCSNKSSIFILISTMPPHILDAVVLTPLWGACSAENQKNKNTAAPSDWNISSRHVVTQTAAEGPVHYYAIRKLRDISVEENAASAVLLAKAVGCVPKMNTATNNTNNITTSSSNSGKSILDNARGEMMSSIMALLEEAKKAKVDMESATVAASLASNDLHTTEVERQRLEAQLDDDTIYMARSTAAAAAAAAATSSSSSSSGREAEIVSLAALQASRVIPVKASLSIIEESSNVSALLGSFVDVQYTLSHRLVAGTTTVGTDELWDDGDTLCVVCCAAPSSTCSSRSGSINPRTDDDISTDKSEDAAATDAMLDTAMYLESSSAAPYETFEYSDEPAVVAAAAGQNDIPVCCNSTARAAGCKVGRVRIALPTAGGWYRINYVRTITINIPPQSGTNTGGAVTSNSSSSSSSSSSRAKDNNAEQQQQQQQVRQIRVVLGRSESFSLRLPLHIAHPDGATVASLRSISSTTAAAAAAAASTSFTAESIAARPLRRRGTGTMAIETRTHESDSSSNNSNNSSSSSNLYSDSMCSVLIEELSNIGMLSVTMCLPQSSSQVGCWRIHLARVMVWVWPVKFSELKRESDSNTSKKDSSGSGSGGDEDEDERLRIVVEYDVITTRSPYEDDDDDDELTKSTDNSQSLAAAGTAPASTKAVVYAEEVRTQYTNIIVSKSALGPLTTSTSSGVNAGASGSTSSLRLDPDRLNLASGAYGELNENGDLCCRIPIINSQSLATQPSSKSDSGIGIRKATVKDKKGEKKKKKEMSSGGSEAAAVPSAVNDSGPFLAIDCAFCKGSLLYGNDRTTEPYKVAPPATETPPRIAIKSMREMPSGVFDDIIHEFICCEDDVACRGLRSCDVMVRPGVALVSGSYIQVNSHNVAASVPEESAAVTAPKKNSGIVLSMKKSLSLIDIWSPLVANIVTTPAVMPERDNQWDEHEQEQSSSTNRKEKDEGGGEGVAYDYSNKCAKVLESAFVAAAGVTALGMEMADVRCARCCATVGIAHLDFSAGDDDADDAEDNDGSGGSDSRDEEDEEMLPKLIAAIPVDVVGALTAHHLAAVPMQYCTQIRFDLSAVNIHAAELDNSPLNLEVPSIPLLQRLLLPPILPIYSNTGYSMMQLERSIGSTILHLNDTHSSTIFCFFIGDRRTYFSKSVSTHDVDISLKSKRSSGGDTTQEYSSTRNINDSILLVKLTSRDFNLAAFNHTNNSDIIHPADTNIGHNLCAQEEVLCGPAKMTAATAVNSAGGAPAMKNLKLQQQQRQQRQCIHAMSLVRALRVSFHLGQLFDKKSTMLLAATATPSSASSPIGRSDDGIGREKVNKLKQKKLQMAGGSSSTSCVLNNTKTAASSNKTQRSPDSGLVLTGAETRVPLQAWQFQALCNILENRSTCCYNIRSNQKKQEKSTHGSPDAAGIYTPSALLL